MRVTVGETEDWYVGVAEYYNATTDCEVLTSCVQYEVLPFHEGPSGVPGLRAKSETQKCEKVIYLNP